MKVGSLVFATDQGLGILARDFYDNGVVTDVMPILHSSRPNHDEWYPKATWISNLRDGEQRGWMQKFCESVDVMLFFETPFWWPVISYCRAVGVKTALMPMYECMPTTLPVKPDLILNPSALDQKYYPEGVQVQVPVDPSTWRLRTRAEMFVHNAGHGGLKGRNGTAELIEALEYVESDARIIIRSQNTKIKQEMTGAICKAVRPGLHVEWEWSTFPREELFKDGDAFVFPEKFNGLSLPLQEARAAGMLVMGTDRFPMNEWLPTAVKTGMSTMSFQEKRENPLVPISGTVEMRDEMRNPLIQSAGYSLTSVGKGTNQIREEKIDPRDIAAKIDEWYGRDITAYSESGREWAERNSWAVLKPRYMELLGGLLQ